jgi:uncharacterized protein (TIGR02118 family)
MIKVSIAYPNDKDCQFDFDYYLKHHIPLAVKYFSANPGYKGVSVERGMSGGAPKSAPMYIAVCHFLFDNMESFGAAFGAHGAELQNDIPNYTNVKSVVQISDVLMSA